MSYELMYRETFAEFLCPDTVYDLIDYHLRECLKREIRIRPCKNCGRLFAVTGHGGTEYCDRPADEKGRIRKEISTFRVGEKAKAQTSHSRCSAGSTKSALPGSRRGRLPHSNTMISAA